MSDIGSTTGAVLAEGMPGIVDDWSADKEAFHVPWGKAMMWIFLLSDTFIFSCFLTSYMNVRMSTTVPWPNPSEVFALTIFGNHMPLILIAIMTFILITSSGTMASTATRISRMRMLSVDRLSSFAMLAHQQALAIAPSFRALRAQDDALDRLSHHGPDT